MCIRLCYAAADTAPVSFLRRTLPVACVLLPGRNDSCNRQHLSSRRDPQYASGRSQKLPLSRNLGRAHTNSLKTQRVWGLGGDHVLAASSNSSEEDSLNQKLQPTQLTKSRSLLRAQLGCDAVLREERHISSHRPKSRCILDDLTRTNEVSLETIRWLALSGRLLFCISRDPACPAETSPNPSPLPGVVIVSFFFLSFLFFAWSPASLDLRHLSPVLTRPDYRL